MLMKKYQKADSLDELSITEYLKFELEIYKLTDSESFHRVLENSKEIEEFIPRFSTLRKG